MKKGTKCSSSSNRNAWKFTGAKLTRRIIPGLSFTRPLPTVNRNSPPSALLSENVLCSSRFSNIRSKSQKWFLILNISFKHVYKA